MTEKLALDVMRAAANCNHCFDSIRDSKRVSLGIPKPRWIGSRYWDACPRVVIVLLNPGDGTGLGEEWNRRERKHFDAFFDSGDYDQVRDYFRTRREEELNGMTSAKPVFSWYESVFGLLFEEISQINMAWCASKGNMYQQMLKPCFERHTGRLLQALEPHAVLLSGANVHNFKRPIERLLSGVDVRQTLHYAHRKGKQAETEEGGKVRAWLQAIRAKRLCGERSQAMVRTLSRSTRPAMEWAKRHLDGPLPENMHETLTALRSGEEMTVKDITAKTGRTKNFGLRHLTALGLVITDKSDRIHRFTITKAGEDELAARGT